MADIREMVNELEKMEKINVIQKITAKEMLEWWKEEPDEKKKKRLLKEYREQLEKIHNTTKRIYDIQEEMRKENSF